MPTPSGQISLNDVNVELGLAGTTTIQMNQANVRTLAGVGGSGTTISMQNLQNKSNRVTASATISSNTSNYTLNTAKAPGYSAGKTDMTLTISPSIYVSSSSTGTAALIVDTSWNAADTVTIVNNGIIVGRGGNGGVGGFFGAGGTGGGGGLALQVQRALTMNNLNRIAGGGGGGGGGGVANNVVASGGGGGGGGGIGGSTGGGASAGGGTAGAAGTLTALGNGGSGSFGSGFGPGEPPVLYTATGGTGGPGGGYGSSGSVGGAGVPALGDRPPGPGGAAGGAITGNSNITYINTGTRNGGIS
jgi:hypothetical protein